MPYCTQQDLVDRFGEDELIALTDRGNTGAIDSQVLDQAIADADAEINAYLAGRYAVPLATVPTVLRRLACNLVRYDLYDDHATDQVTKLREDAVKFLRSASRGEVSLGVSQEGTQAQPADLAEMTSGGRIFGRDDSGFL